MTQRPAWRQQSSNAFIAWPRPWHTKGLLELAASRACLLGHRHGHDDRLYRVSRVHKPMHIGRIRNVSVFVNSYCGNVACNISSTCYPQILSNSCHFIRDMSVELNCISLSMSKGNECFDSFYSCILRVVTLVESFRRLNMGYQNAWSR